MAVSVFDLFKIGIGPSSSHTVGPMRAAHAFVQRLQRQGALAQVARLRCQLFGSLGATGIGHASDRAVILGLAGHAPDTVDVNAVDAIIAQVNNSQQLLLNGEQRIVFDPATDLLLIGAVSLPFHPNGMRFEAWDAQHELVDAQAYYSVGGGFIVSEEAAHDAERQQAIAPDTDVLPLPFHSAAQLLQLAHDHQQPIAQIMRTNERHWRSDADIDSGLRKIWQAMQDCVQRGCSTQGRLPGGLNVKRRAAGFYEGLTQHANTDPLEVIDWVNLFALAVNEENAAGGRVVTAPTNGAAGIVPAVLHYYWRFVPGATEAGVVDFLLTAGAIGILYKENASISGAEVGCQGEVGVACSMAAAGLCAVLGGTPAQVENAAEIGMEHHLGLTCDPVAGLVQVPCIERNALAAVKAINAARMALRGDGSHIVSLDKVIATMRATGADMMSKYKETSLGGLAVHIVEC
ncbi:L-serine ammonia-lyase [Comamonas sp. B21-038]|uniref:L-serine ammonia-lyase n=1 Tax=Comamonas sp. B21-038 TaxID=2918299 RepID=UPI001EFBFD8D|nr:L-serine ammonia-lyase [Comamonas sp. B21-038]ULR88720.1 L-serine ammonia-lyase [Comamonas sp. B21-038]